jgi:hypothetical protein
MASLKSKLKAVKPVAAEISKPKVLIFGAPGVGKTWFSISAPQPYMIDTEGGARRPHYIAKLERSGGVYLGPDQGSRSIEEITQQLQALAVEKHPYKTVIIDSISQPYKDLIIEEAARLGDKDAYGASKKPATQQIRRLAMWADRLPLSVIFVAHEKDVWGPTGKTGVTFDCDPGLAYRLDLCIHVMQIGAQRKGKVVKSRLEGFPPGDQFDWEFDVFAQRYGREIIEKEATPIVLATPAQLDEVRRLLEVVRLPDGTIEKWFTAANVTDWPEFDTDRIQKCISALKTKILASQIPA